MVLLVGIIYAWASIPSRDVNFRIAYLFLTAIHIVSIWGISKGKMCSIMWSQYMWIWMCYEVPLVIFLFDRVGTVIFVLLHTIWNVDESYSKCGYALYTKVEGEISCPLGFIWPWSAFIRSITQNTPRVFIPQFLLLRIPFLHKLQSIHHYYKV